MTLALTTGKRIIKDGSRFNKLFPPESAAYGSHKVLRNKGDVFQTVKYIGKIIKNDAADTALIAPLLKGKTRTETLQNIHRFMINYLQYDTESGEKLRSPRRTWWVGQKQHDKETGDSGVDCDDLVIFSGSILYNLGTPFYIRIVKINNDDFQHVYIVVPADGRSLSGSYITLDGVISKFNYEYPYKQQNTFDMSGVKIEYLGNLTGIESAADVRSLLEHFLININSGTIKPTKINSGDLKKMLEFLLKNWDNPETRIKSLEFLAEKESVYYPEQQFFAKLYQLEGSMVAYLAGDFGPNPDFNHDGTEDTDGSWSNNGGGSNGGNGSQWAEAGIALLNVLAHFDWGLIGGNNQQTQPPVPVPQPESAKNQIAGFTTSTILTVLLVGGGAYLVYENFLKANENNKTIGQGRMIARANQLNH